MSKVKKIVINNLKNIKNMEFTFPNEGVYLLTGKNGCGKTTLLVAMNRIGDIYAFRNNYITSADEKIDTFDKSTIEYSVDNAKVIYQKKKEKWSPTPKSKAGVLKKFEYSTSMFIRADSKRIEPTKKEFEKKQLTRFNPQVIKDICYVLEDESYKELRKMKVDRGRGKEVIVRKASNGQLYSEKNFSLGELSIIHILEQLNTAQEKSLVIIDEVEMSLHPKAQYKLLDVLKRIATEKKLTIFVSTHSVTMIKNMDYRNIYYLENNKGVVTVKNPVYQAEILGYIDFKENVTPDIVIAVEDNMARNMLQQMINCYMNYVTSRRAEPVYKIIPIGTADSVVRFIENINLQNYLGKLNAKAVLDGDKKEELSNIINKTDKTEGDRNYIELMERNKTKVFYLPTIPEVDLVDYIENEFSYSSQEFETETGINIDFPSIINQADYQATASIAKRGERNKKKFKILISKAEELSMSKQNLIDTMFKYYIEHELKRQDVCMLVAKLIS